MTDWGVLVREGSKQREKAACLSSSMALGNYYSVSLCIMYYCLQGTTYVLVLGSCAWNREGCPDFSLLSCFLHGATGLCKCYRSSYGRRRREPCISGS